MLIQVKRKLRPIDSPQRHEGHKRPVTRRDFIAQGFLAGGATLLGGGIMSLFANRVRRSRRSRKTSRR
jgi:hypothetical protein